MAILTIIYILVFIIFALIAYAILQIKMFGMKIKDFWSFIEANQMLDKLYKFAIYKLEKNHTAIYVKLHHIIADAWVTKILLNQFMEYYNLFHNNETYIDIEQPSYINYINAEKQYFSSEKFNKDKAFWDSYLNSFTEAIPFKEIANKKTSSSNRYTNELDCSDKINEFCKIITLHLMHFSLLYILYIYIKHNQKQILQ